MASTQWNHRTTLTIDGVFLGSWQSKTGGDSDSNTVQFQLGGIGGQVSLGGSPMTANIVLSRLEDAEILAHAKWLRSRAGRGKGTLTETLTDDEDMALGDPTVYSVRLKRAKGSDRNTNSNTAAEFEVELEVNGLPT